MFSQYRNYTNGRKARWSLQIDTNVIHDPAMTDRFDPSFFSQVPQYQIDLIRQFVADHPYKEATVGETSLRYLACGEGKSTVLFLSGAMASPYMWFHAISEFEGGFRILAPEFPNIGLSANDALEKISALIALEQVDRVTIVGYSFGGGVAQYLAEMIPERIEALVLTHTGVLRREDALAATARRLKILRLLPDVTRLIRMVRSMAGKESEWWAFRNGLLRWMAGSAGKQQMISLLEANLRFYADIEHLPIGEVTWTGRTMILGTESDRDTFPYYYQLCDLYAGSDSRLFRLPSRHHTIFLYPEEHTAALQRFIT